MRCCRKRFLGEAAVEGGHVSAMRTRAKARDYMLSRNVVATSRRTGISNTSLRGEIMKRVVRQLYFWVLIGIFSGGLLGYVNPPFAVSLKPLGDGFIALVKMLINPIIFCTVLLGISGAGDMKKVGRVGGKALLYFEVVSTFALLIGLTVVNVVRPGAGFNADPRTLDANAVADYAKRAANQSTGDFILHLIPT